jgi:hypothetical protein
LGFALLAVVVLLGGGVGSFTGWLWVTTISVIASLLGGLLSF